MMENYTFNQQKLMIISVLQMIYLKMVTLINVTALLKKLKIKRNELNRKNFLIPTAENIAYIAWHRIRAKLDDALKLHITLYETDRNFIEYDGQ